METARDGALAALDFLALSPQAAEAHMDALDPERADDFLDELLARGWTVAYVPHGYRLVPPAADPSAARHVHGPA